jgi:ATP-dependent Lhr-like helicase
LLSVVQGWMLHSGPVSAAELAARLRLEPADVDAAMLRLEASGAVLRGHFSAAEQWCDRRLLARIHRLTLGRLRREIEPVTAAAFMRWLIEWQHVAPGSQVIGERGTLEVLHQLQGFEAPASAGEPQLLRRRVLNYDPAVLDRLSLTGAIGWGRLSPHPATFEVAGGTRRRVVPTSVAPMTFFVRDESDWMSSEPKRGPDGAPAGLSPNAAAVFACLRRAGASFFPDIVRGTKQLKAEVEAALCSSRRAW